MIQMTTTIEFQVFLDVDDSFDVFSSLGFCSLFNEVIKIVHVCAMVLAVVEVH